MYREIQGIKENVLDPGGVPIFDNEGNVKGKTEPLIELVHNSKIKLLISATIKQALNEFFLDIRDLKNIWMAFIKMDKKSRGYITLLHLFDYLDEAAYSVIAPYLERFFDLIDKQKEDRVTFEELFPSLCAFCMFDRTEMIAFVFSMLDKDNDKRVSQVDILKFLSLYREGLRDNRQTIKLFPVNVTVRAQLYDFERGDNIDIQEFVYVANEQPYIVFPAFRLQDQLREMFGGVRLWMRAKKKLDEQETNVKIQ